MLSLNKPGVYSVFGASGAGTTSFLKYYIDDTKIKAYLDLSLYKTKTLDTIINDLIGLGVEYISIDNICAAQPNEVSYFSELSYICKDKNIVVLLGAQSRYSPLKGEVPSDSNKLFKNSDVIIHISSHSNLKMKGNQFLLQEFNILKTKIDLDILTYYSLFNKTMAYYDQMFNSIIDKYKPSKVFSNGTLKFLINNTIYNYRDLLNDIKI